MLYGVTRAPTKGTKGIERSLVEDIFTRGRSQDNAPAGDGGRVSQRLKGSSEGCSRVSGTLLYE